MPVEPKTGQHSNKEHGGRIKRFMPKYERAQRYKDAQKVHPGLPQVRRFRQVVFIHSHDGGFKLAANSKH